MSVGAVSHIKIYLKYELERLLTEQKTSEISEVFYQIQWPYQLSVDSETLKTSS